MDEIKLPIKYALVPVKSASGDVIAYIIVKCYFLEGKISYNIDGTIDAKCKVVECKNANLAFANNTINDEYVYEVSCVFNDISLAKDEQNRVNELIIESIKQNYNMQELLMLKEKQEATVKSMEKLRAITDKKFNITSQEKRLIL